MSPRPRQMLCICDPQRVRSSKSSGLESIKEDKKYLIRHYSKNFIIYIQTQENNEALSKYAI